jgi:hypothetical protein
VLRQLGVDRDQLDAHVGGGESTELDDDMSMVAVGARREQRRFYPDAGPAGANAGSAPTGAISGRRLNLRSGG